jgi:hypothetical protein
MPFLCTFPSGILRFRIFEVSKEDSATSYFHLLVDHVRADIVSNLDKYTSYAHKPIFVDDLMSAYPDLGRRDIQGRVSWRVIGVEKEPNLNMLDVLRSILLTAVDSVVTFNVGWKPNDAPMYEKWKLILSSEKLRTVMLYDLRAVQGEKISNNVRTLKIKLPGDLHPEVAWSLVTKDTFVPARLEKVVIEAVMRDRTVPDFPMSLTERGGAAFFALFSDVPRIDFVNLHPTPEFWDGFTYDNLVELSIRYDDWHEGYCVPLGEFVNLRKLELRVFDDLKNLDVDVPQLRTLELRNVKMSAFKRAVFEHLGRVAPNVENLTIDSEGEVYESPYEKFLVNRRLFAVTIPENFTSLERMNLAVPLDVTGVLGMVDSFEKLRPGGVEEVKVKGLVFYTSSECVAKSRKVARWAKEKRRQNRTAAIGVFVEQGRFSSNDYRDHVTHKRRSRPSYLFTYNHH